MLIGQDRESFIELLTSTPDMPFYQYKKQIGVFSEMYMFADKFGWTPAQYRELYDNDHETYMQFRSFLSGLSSGTEQKASKK
jgi:hypothetical protein